MNRILTAAALVLFAAAPFSRADAGYFLAVDVPTALGGTDVQPNQVARQWNGTYSVVAVLDPSVTIGAFTLLADGSILFAPESPVTLGGVDYAACDLVTCNGSNCSAFLRGSAYGIPADARIDAVTLDAAGNALVSFDTPVVIAGTNFSQNDLVKLSNNAATLAWDSSAAGLPPDANVMGAGIDQAGEFVFSFDTPVTVGGSNFALGDLAVWSGGAFGTYASDSGWTPGSAVADLAFAPGAGEVPDGARAAGPQLTVTRAPDSQVKLVWAATCRSTDTDYAVYEGTLGNFASHAPRLCTTAGATSATIAPAGSNDYYLVAARNAFAEGSLGHASNGTDRPQAANACVPRSEAAACP